MHGLSTLAKIKLRIIGIFAAARWGVFAVRLIAAVVFDDVREQIANAPRPLPTYYAGNPLGYNVPRPFVNYGAPHYGGVGSNVTPPISPEEFRLNFLFGPDKIPEVLASLQLPQWQLERHWGFQISHTVSMQREILFDLSVLKQRYWYF